MGALSSLSHSCSVKSPVIDDMDHVVIPSVAGVVITAENEVEAISS